MSPIVVNDQCFGGSRLVLYSTYCAHCSAFFHASIARPELTDKLDLSQRHHRVRNFSFRPCSLFEEMWSNRKYRSGMSCSPALERWPNASGNEGRPIRSHHLILRQSIHASRFRGIWLNKESKKALAVWNWIGSTQFRFPNFYQTQFLRSPMPWPVPHSQFRCLRTGPGTQGSVEIDLWWSSCFVK